MSKSIRQVSKTAESRSEIEGEASGQDVMREILSKPSQVGKARQPEPERIDNIVIGTLSAITEGGQPLIKYENQSSDQPLAALSTKPLIEQDLGREVALSFVEGDSSRPIILGLVQGAGQREQSTSKKKMDVELDGERLVFTADKDIVLKCGKSSITLTRAGKIILKGAYLSNYSTGVNRIKGGSVQIN